MYTAASTVEAASFFVDNLPTTSESESADTVRIVEAATEALGAWRAFGLEGCCWCRGSCSGS